VIAAIRGCLRSASCPLDVELWLAGSDEVVHAAGQLLANLKVRVRWKASSDRSTCGSVKQSAVLCGLNSFVFDPSSISFLVVKVSVSTSFLRTLNDVGLSALSGGCGLSQVDQVAGTAQNTLDGLVNKLGLMAISGGEALAH
jgi:hypothetical protein